MAIHVAVEERWGGLLLGDLHSTRWLDIIPVEPEDLQQGYQWVGWAAVQVRSGHTSRHHWLVVYPMIACAYVAHRRLSENASCSHFRLDQLEAALGFALAQRNGGYSSADELWPLLDRLYQDFCGSVVHPVPV